MVKRRAGIRTVLFDFDGTLAPSLELWLEAFRYGFASFDCVLTDDVIVQKCFYRDYDETAREFSLPSGVEFERQVLDGLSQVFSAVELHPGVSDVLDFCQKSSLALGLVTSSPRPQVEAALVKLKLDAVFSVVVTGSDITHFKPHPEPVVRALRLLDAAAPSALFVGDYTADVLAGQAAGTRTALFLPPSHARFYDFATLRATNPDFIFSDYAELLTHLRSEI